MPEQADGRVCCQLAEERMIISNVLRRCRSKARYLGNVNKSAIAMSNVEHQSIKISHPYAALQQTRTAQPIVPHLTCKPQSRSPPCTLDYEGAWAAAAENKWQLFCPTLELSSSSCHRPDLRLLRCDSSLSPAFGWTGLFCSNGASFGLSRERGGAVRSGRQDKRAPLNPNQKTSNAPESMPRATSTTSRHPPRSSHV